MKKVLIATPPEVLWPMLSDPAIVASCIPGAVLTKSGEGGIYEGTMRVKFGPTLAVFRGEAKLAYDHSARRCTIQVRGIDGRSYLLSHFYVRQVQGTIDGAPDEPLSRKRHHLAGWSAAAL